MHKTRFFFKNKSPFTKVELTSFLHFLPLSQQRVDFSLLTFATSTRFLDTSMSGYTGCSPAECSRPRAARANHPHPAGGALAPGGRPCGACGNGGSWEKWSQSASTRWRLEPRLLWRWARTPACCAPSMALWKQMVTVNFKASTNISVSLSHSHGGTKKELAAKRLGRAYGLENAWMSTKAIDDEAYRQFDKYVCHTDYYCRQDLLPCSFSSPQCVAILL